MKLKLKKPKHEWSPNGYIFAHLRKIWRWSPSRKLVLKRAETENGQFNCSGCKSPFDKKGVAIDHKEPVIDPNKGFEGWDKYITRLFCSDMELQVLCNACHSIKTKAENKLRRETKKRGLK